MAMDHLEPIERLVDKKTLMTPVERGRRLLCQRKVRIDPGMRENDGPGAMDVLHALKEPQVGFYGSGQ